MALLFVSMWIILIPFIGLSIYNFPAADDYAFANQYLTYGFWDAQKKWYLNWTGRYISSIFSSIGPQSFDSLVGYRVLSLLVFFAVFGAIYFLISSVIGYSFSIKKKAVFSTVMFGLFIYKMPSPMEGFYWYGGYSFYTTSLVAMCLIVGVYLRSEKISLFSSGAGYFANHKKIGAIVMTFLMAAIAGMNESCLPVMTLLIVVAMGYEYFTLSKKIQVSTLISAFLFFLGSAISILAPGNRVRAALYPQAKHLLPALWYSISVGIEIMFSYFSIPLLFIFLLLTPWILLNKDKMNPLFWSKHIRVMTILLLCFSCIGFIFPSYYAVDTRPPYRALNVLVLIHLILISLIYVQSVLAYSGWFKQKKLFQGEIKIVRVFGVAFLLSFIFGMNIYNAWGDFLFNANQYSRQMAERIAYTRSMSGQKIKLRPLTVKPQTIYYGDDITNDPNHWINTAYAKFYGLESVVIED